MTIQVSITNTGDPNNSEAKSAQYRVGDADAQIVTLAPGETITVALHGEVGLIMAEDFDKFLNNYF